MSEDDKKSNVVNFPGGFNRKSESSDGNNTENKTTEENSPQPANLHAIGGAPQESEPTFKEFAMQITSGDITSATNSLSHLFNIDVSDARSATEHFAGALKAKPETIMKTMQLKSAVESDTIDQFMILISECFGIRGQIAAECFRHLKTQLT